MKRILITGGAGFIGSQLCERLLNEGNEVLCLDNYFTGSKRNIKDLLDNPYFELIRHDVTAPYYVEVDEIYNLACPASPIHYQYNPIKTVKTSVMGAINMLGLAKRIKAKILQASTSEVYGDPSIHPQPESYWGNVNPVGIRSCYDEGKRCAETLFTDYYHQNGVKIKIIRIFNTYGPKMHPNDGRVVSNFIVQALRNEDITIYGDGSQTRSFQYVDDLLEGMIRIGRDAAYRLLKARILLKADVTAEGDGWDDARIAEALETSASTVFRTRRQLVEEGLEAALSRKKRQSPPTSRIFDGEAEARLLQLACSEPPEGHARWSLRLLEKRVVELGIVEAASDSTIQRVLKKTRSNRTLAAIG